MRKLQIVVGWFSLSFLTLIITLFTFYLLDDVKGEEASKNQYGFYAAVPQVLGSFTTTVQAADARPELIRQYLEKYKSPLLPYSDLIISLSDQYGLDFRLIVAIAQCESNVCKIIPPESYNCWGFENGATHFRSWEQALNQVAKTLKEGYIDQGLVTPELIMSKYAPPSVKIGGPWARCVSQFMNELQ